MSCPELIRQLKMIIFRSVVIIRRPPGPVPGTWNYSTAEMCWVIFSLGSARTSLEIRNNQLLQPGLGVSAAAAAARCLK